MLPGRYHAAPATDQWGSRAAMNLEHIVLVLQMSIGPMIVISGAGLVLLSMTNRFGRVVDRVRILAEARRREAGSETPRISQELRILMRRARILRLAIAFASTSVLTAASLVIVLFLAVVLQLDAAMLVIVMFILCMGFLITGLIFFIADVNVSLAALALELDEAPRRSARS